MPVPSHSRDSSLVSNLSTTNTIFDDTASETSALALPSYVSNLPNSSSSPKPPKSIPTSKTSIFFRKTPKKQRAATFKSVPALGDPWLPGVLRRLPYGGALGLLATLLCAAACAFVLYESDGQEQSVWIAKYRFSPSVYLNVFSSGASFCLGTARSQGFVIAWWYKALRGSTLYNLQKTWDHGDSLWAAAFAGRRTDFVSLATLLAASASIAGPLLQGASNTISVPNFATVNVSALIAQEIPYGYTSYGYPGGTGVMTSAFKDVMNAYTNRDPIVTDFEGCVGNCTGTILAAGLAYNCTSEEVPFEMNVHNDFQTVFYIDTELWHGGPYGYGSSIMTPYLNYTMISTAGRTAPTYQSDGAVFDSLDPTRSRGDCNGTQLLRTCQLESATLQYNIALINGTVTLGNASALPVDHIQAVGNASDLNFVNDYEVMPSTYSTLGGLAIAAQQMFGSNATQVSTLMLLTGALATQYIDYGDWFDSQDACSANWQDPTNDIVNALNEIMFRTALMARSISKYAIYNTSYNGPNSFETNFYEIYPPLRSIDTPGAGGITKKEMSDGIPVAQRLSMQQSGTIVIFQSKYEYLAAALAVMMLGILVVLPTFHGFWELGRTTSLNPVEIAKAFNAGMMESEGSNAPADKYLIDGKYVQYGEVFAEGFQMSKGHNRGPMYRRQKLEMADPGQVRKPRAQAMYT